MPIIPGTTLYVLIRRKGSVKQWAASVGVHYNTIFNTLRGQRPGKRARRIIEEACGGVPFDDLMKPILDVLETQCPTKRTKRAKQPNGAAPPA